MGSMLIYHRVSNCEFARMYSYGPTNSYFYGIIMMYNQLVIGINLVHL